MLNHQRFNEGTELSLLLINVYNETKAKVNPQTLGNIFIDYYVILKKKKNLF